MVQGNTPLLEVQVVVDVVLVWPGWWHMVSMNCTYGSWQSAEVICTEASGVIIFENINIPFCAWLTSHMLLRLR